MNILERMKDRAQKTKADLDAERIKNKREKERLEAERAADDAPDYKRDNVYCSDCKRDYVATLRKHGNPSLLYYQGTCPFGHNVRREFTLYDRYYDLSPFIRSQRLEYADDLLTPNDARFKTVYPEQWAEYERQREERDAAT